MDDEEFAALERELIERLVEADRARAAAEDLTRAYRLERERRERGATVHPIRPEPADDPELDELRAAHRDWHIWVNDEGWHAVKNAHSDPITEPTAADLDRRLGPDAT